MYLTAEVLHGQTYQTVPSRMSTQSESEWRILFKTLYVKLDETVGTTEPPMPGFKDLAVGEIGKCYISMSFEGG